MTMPSPSPTGPVNFQLVVPPGLERILSATPELPVQEVHRAPERVSHDLTLESIALVVTLAVGVHDLAVICRKLSVLIHDYFSDNDEDFRSIKIIGVHDEDIIEIDVSDVRDTEKTIRIVVGN